MMELRKLTAVAAAALVASATAAGAVSLSIDSVDGVWTGVTENPAQPATSFVDGLGTNVLSWGSATQRSNYTFDGVAPPSVVVGASPTPFLLGTVTHNNQPIPLRSGILGAELTIDFDLSFVNGAPFPFSYTSMFEFTHTETPNAANPCADGGANGVGINLNGCADSIGLVANQTFTKSIVKDKMKYTFTMLGFKIGDDPNNLEDFGLLWTTENGATSAGLWGTFTVAPIPLPAAGFLLLGALGGLGLMARRKAA
jgi:opacity protein-like surface antigen